MRFIMRFCTFIALDIQCRFTRRDANWLYKVETKKTRLKTTGDKLRYYRHKKGLKQS